MYNLDIAALLREALAISGCSDQQIGQFDGHSTIELDFRDLPSMNIALTDGDVWCWSKLMDFNPSSCVHFAEPLLNFLMEGFHHARTEQMQLVVVEGMLEVRVLLSEAAVSSGQAFSEAIDAYVSQLERLQGLLR